MAKNRSFTGGKRSVGTPTLNKEQYFQLIRKIRNAAPPKADGETAEEYETHINITQKKGKIKWIKTLR